MPPPGQQHQHRSGQGREPHGHCLLRSPILPASTGRAQVEASWRGTGLCPRGDQLVGAQSGEERERTEVGARRKLQMNNDLHICLQLQPTECPGPKSLHPTPISAPF